MRFLYINVHLDAEDLVRGFMAYGMSDAGQPSVLQSGSFHWTVQLGPCRSAASKDLDRPVLAVVLRAESQQIAPTPQALSQRKRLMSGALRSRCTHANLAHQAQRRITAQLLLVLLAHSGTTRLRWVRSSATSAQLEVLL